MKYRQYANNDNAFCQVLLSLFNEHDMVNSMLLVIGHVCCLFVTFLHPKVCKCSYYFWDNRLSSLTFEQENYSIAEILFKVSGNFSWRKFVLAKCFISFFSNFISQKDHWSNTPIANNFQALLQGSRTWRQEFRAENIQLVCLSWFSLWNYILERYGSLGHLVFVAIVEEHLAEKIVFPQFVYFLAYIQSYKIGSYHWKLIVCVVVVKSKIKICSQRCMSFHLIHVN